MSKSIARMIYYSLIPLWLIVVLLYDFLHYLEVKK